MYFLIFGIVPKKCEKFDFFYMRMLRIFKKPQFLTLHGKNVW